MRDDTQQFTIVHAPFNPYSAGAFGLVFKLSYASRGRDKPTLEIFRDDEEARSKEWHIYGTLLDESDDRFATVSFMAVGECKGFRVGREAFDVTFVDVQSEPGCIAGQNEQTFVYAFSAERSG